MRTYDVFESSNGKYEAVKHGFNPLAFMYGLALPLPGFIGFLWPFVEVKQLRYGFVILALVTASAAVIGIIMALATVPEIVAGVLVAATGAVVFGFLGNRWRTRSLRSAGAQCVGEQVEARNEDEAITTARPEVVRANRLVKSAEWAFRDGHPEDAAIIYEHALTECRGDHNVLTFVREALKNVKLRPAHLPAGQA